MPGMGYQQLRALKQELEDLPKGIREAGARLRYADRNLDRVGSLAKIGEWRRERDAAEAELAAAQARGPEIEKLLLRSWVEGGRAA